MLKALRGIVLLILVFGFSLSRQSSGFQQSAPPRAGSNSDQTKTEDFSSEGFVIEQLINDVVFESDGTGQEERSARIRIQSDAGIQAFGVLSFGYRNAFERLEIIQLQVEKPDGSVVTTPESDVQDGPTEVTRQAPTYSDSREKQVPVKGLGVGDVLEWRVRTTRTSADIPGQFWYAHDFVKESIVLDETLRVTVPAGKYVKTSSPSLDPNISQKDGQKIYTWKSSQRERPKPDEKKKKSTEPAHPDVQLSTFRSWEEVGRWYGGLQRPKAAVTPAVQSKAAELTRNLSTTSDKLRAIYRFVSTKFRYISVSFGEGRYQPHSADEVLSNQYGDCKDKDTLLQALLAAAGIEAWPVLIGAGSELDPDVPSPAQFNHVIAYVPGNPSATWLDTTPEVAPFGMLQSVLRDKKALVIPNNGTPSVMTTPEGLPFPADESWDVKAKLSGEGTLTGHFDITARGDTEVILKGVYHATAPAQWTQLAQNMAGAMGFAGTVSRVAVDNPTDTEKPFHYSYDYERKNYSDWENRRFTPPLLPVSFEDTEEQPAESIDLGAPGTLTYRASIEIPEGYSVAIPGNAEQHAAFADYRASYSVDKGVLVAERTFVRKKAKVAVGEWEEYQKFAKAVITDENNFIQLARSGGGTKVTRDNAEAGDLVRKAVLSIQSRDFNAARDALAQAERLNAEQTGLWAAYGFLYGVENQVDKAIEALEKEVELHPGEIAIYPMLAAAEQQAGRKEDEIRTRRQWVENALENVDAVLGLSAVLTREKRYAEAIEPLQAALKSNPDDVKLETGLLETLLRSGKIAESESVLAKLREQKLDSETKNSVAWVLVDTNVDPAAAQDLAGKAVTELEEESKQLTLSKVTSETLRRIIPLGATWDTLGWAYFRTGDLAKAERFLQAAWVLLQHPVAADHLGQLYERQGKKSEAIHFYRLSLAANRNQPDTQARLEKLGGTVDDRPTLRRGRPNTPPTVPAADELSQIRSTPVPGLLQHAANAEFFLLFTPKGIVETRFVKGDEKLKGAGDVLSKLTYKVSFPDDGPERIARRGILSCSQYTNPNCNFVVYLPANTQP